MKKIIASILISSSLLGGIATTWTSLNSEIALAATTPSKKPGSAPGKSSISNAKLAGKRVITNSTKLINQKISSTKGNQSAIYVKNGGNLSFNKGNITKTGKTSSDDNSNFYGQNAGLLVTKKGSAIVNNLSETTNAEGANAIFATGLNSTIKLTNSNIKTYQNSSRGLDATLKGTIKATNTDITTQGSHSATLATDRGGGTVSLNKGTLKTAGDGSPILYSTGNINAKNITGNATGAEAAVIEGANSINVTNSHLTGNKNNGVMLYQSMSGDAEEGTATFNMKNGTLTSTVKNNSKGTTNRTGALFYVTNTKAKVALTNVELKNASNTLIRLASDRWGTSGKNGGDLTFVATNQILKGNIQVNTGSSLNLILKNESSLTGNINSSKKSGTVQISLGNNAKWNVTGNSYITSLKATTATLKNINSHGHNIYYTKSNSSNSWLNGKTYKLTGGGKLIAE